MKIKETSTIKITGATWAQAVLAVTDPEGVFAPGFANAPRSWAQLAAEAMEQAGVEDLAQQVILSASEPGFGAHRSFKLMDGSVEPRIEDWRGGHWSVLTESTLERAEWTSGSSGSTITVDRVGDGWTITGSFPVVDERYEGTYFDSLQSAVTDVRREQEALRLRAELKEIADELVVPIWHAAHEALNTFQAWMGADVQPSQTDVDTAIRILTDAGWSHRMEQGEAPYRTVLVAVAPEGWDGGVVERLLAIRPDRVPTCTLRICPVPDAAPADWELEATQQS